jgi:hypothetical protein
MGLMNTSTLGLAPFLLLMGLSACTQTPIKPPGSTTFSPYTPGQIQEFNKRAADAKFYNQPQGEEEAEALETQSADPYQSTKPVFTF